MLWEQDAPRTWWEQHKLLTLTKFESSGADVKLVGDLQDAGTNSLRKGQHCLNGAA